MAYITAFLEGIISFISPCILPILPLYFSYLAGGVAEQDQEKNLLLKNSIAFVIGFTIMDSAQAGSEERDYGSIILPDQGEGRGPLYFCLIRRDV